MERMDLEKAFFEFYENESDALFRFVFFRVNNRETAQDIVQESFTQYWKACVALQVIENKRAFLFRIASNKVIDRYRKAKEYSLDQLTEKGFDAPEQEGIPIEVHIDMAHALQVLKTLPEKYQEAVWLRSVEEWSVQDIALHLGESVNVVSVRIFRGIRLWRDRLTGKNGGLSKKRV